jgi:hypothetical protein
MERPWGVAVTAVLVTALGVLPPLWMLAAARKYPIIPERAKTASERRAERSERADAGARDSGP